MDSSSSDPATAQAISRLTSRQAVLDALSEFDRHGREAFLRLHGFGEATNYFVVHEGKAYDSKAVAGVAFGHQFPARGPLRPNQFSGGDASVLAALERLDFVVKTKVELERQFSDRMFQLQTRAKAMKPAISFPGFQGMLTQHGAKGTAELLLNKQEISDGFTDLWLHPTKPDSLRLSVEYMVLEGPWRIFFTERQLQV